MTSEPYDRDTHTQIDRLTHTNKYNLYNIHTYILPTYIQTYIHTCIHVKFTVAVDCVCPHCCSVELAQLYVSSLLGTGLVVLSQTLLNVWSTVHRYVGLLYTYLYINTAS